MTHKFPYSPQPLRKVTHVQFGLLSPEVIRQMSVCEVTSAERFGGKPKENALSDLRLGNISREHRCTTCECDGNECCGHFGHIELAQPLFHLGFMSIVVQILRSICFSCSRLKIPCKTDPKFKEALELPPKDRLPAMYKLCSKRTQCDEKAPDDTNTVIGCSSPQPKITRDGFKIIIEFKSPVEGQEGKSEITAGEVIQKFKLIGDEDCRFLGLDPEYSRPDWMIITVLPVPPPQVRPTIMIGSTSKGEDDLTYKLADIIKVNAQLRKIEENSAPAHAIKDYTKLLQFHIATYFNNEIPGELQSTQKSGRPTKSICQRLKGKEGRVRGNLMGKRVDFSARTVITPDPNIAIDQVGVPRSIAKQMSFPEIVTPYNIKDLQELVVRGPYEHPGALYVIKDGVREDLRYVKDLQDIHLSCGDRVERHLKDGDVIIFNRQPSLHKMSMMGHRIKIMPFSSFRLNLSVTTPYNADFDGDEMNLHVPQNVETRAEVLQLMMVPKQIVSPQGNKPVIGLVQDTLLACSIFSRRDCFMEKDVVMNLLMWLPKFDGKIPIPAILAPIELWTGKQLFSLLLQSNPINLHKYSNTRPKKVKEPAWMSPSDTEVLVEQGEIVSGILDKNCLARSEGGIIHLLWNEYGSEAAKNFLGQAQQLINNWLVARGYTIGIGDTIADDNTVNNIHDIINQAKTQVNELILSLHQGELEAKPGMSLIESFESDVNKVLNKARDDAGEFATHSLDRHNNIKTMVNAGSKGSFINIAQMVACVGQQNVEGRRIPYGFRQRTLPHFMKDDLGVDCRGFVENSYLRGLTPQEFFFHAMGGREGLIDTAVKTSETGYIQRRLVKAMEDVMVHYDGTIRNSLGDVIQFLYGEDGMDAIAVESQTLESYSLNDQQLEGRYRYNFDHQNLGLGDGVLNPEIIEDMKSEPELIELLEEEFKTIKADRDEMRLRIIPKKDEERWPLPVNIRRLILNIQKQFSIEKLQQPTNLTPSEIIKQVKILCDSRLKLIPGDDEVTRESQKNATQLFTIHVRAILASKRVLREFHLTREAFDVLLREIEAKFRQAIVHPGEMVGAIAAQSIGEPATQMTLNTFHYAGVSSKNVTLGVPRLKEIINVAKQTKTPSVTVYLQPDRANDNEFAKGVLTQLEHTTVRRVTAKTSIWYDPNPSTTVIPQDVDLVEISLLN